MTISLPSREIYAVDVPEVKDFSATFRYNFFSPDESVDESGGVPSFVLNRSAETIDANFLQFSSTRTPRYVLFSFTPVKLSDRGRHDDVDIRENAIGKDRPKRLITDNMDKIVVEDQLVNNNYVSVSFHDSELRTKMNLLVSGTIEMYTDDVEFENNNDLSMYRAASALGHVLPNDIKPSLLVRSVSQPENKGLTFFNDVEGRSDKLRSGPPGRGNTRRRANPDAYFERLAHVTTTAQVNSKLLFDIVDRMVSDPVSTFGDDITALHRQSKQARQLSIVNTLPNISEDDYRPIVPYVALNVGPSSHTVAVRPIEIVGYVIDKFEVTATGNLVQHTPIVIENPNVHTTADFKVKYGTTYVYGVRTIVKVTMPAVDVATGEVATAEVLVSSKPSNKVYVETIEGEAPPPPVDLSFTWRYETDELLIHWSFPTNPQRDIKKFQVFRRDSVDHPFELLKMYNFDDSIRRYEDLEDPDPTLVEQVNSPVTSFVDSEFTRTSRFIYAVAALDAHGLTSNYSAQFEVSFDQFKNKLVKKLVSHVGAPKPYPNMYLNADLFVDTIRVSGPHSKRARIYFNPEYYYIVDDQNRTNAAFESIQTGGEYNVLFINTDNQKSANLKITIDDNHIPQLKKSKILRPYKQIPLPK